MKPILYDKTGKTQLGVLEHCINCFTEEERNGGFTLTLTYPITDELHKDLIYDNIIVVKANDEYDNQQFRIAVTERIIKGTVTVKAVHISYDLVYDLVQNVSFENQSCEYALNQLFRNSHFSKHYRGYSNIVNAQNYSAHNKNIWEAIVGSTGSIVDTYGKGPEIIRDNTNIHVLNKRGTDRGVVIEYSVNMLDEALEIDASSIVTSIYGFARYTDEENNEHTVSAPRINSSLMDNYAHPFIISKDYTDRFEQGVIPTEAQVQSLVELDFQDGIDQPKCNYTINFVPLSKCAGYEDIQDQIHLCDIVTIKDRRYNINTKANVIKYKYNVLLERYDSMELGDARNTLTQTIVGSTQKDLEQKINDKIIIDNKNYPDTLPASSVITLHAGLGTIQVDWTYERKAYYTYQLYGSTQQGFTPTSADLLYEGQASSFLHTVEPGSTWYYRVRAKNTHGKFNEFSEEAGITCFLIDENTTYIEKGAIQDAHIGTLNLDRGWVGELKGQWIDARNLTVTDANGVRTLDIDSYGNVKITGSTVIGSGNGNKIKINNADYEILNGSTPKGFFGLRKLDDGFDTARLALSSTGIKRTNDNYFAIVPYNGDGYNPQEYEYPYVDIAYRCQGFAGEDGHSDVSNLKMYGDGVMRLSPIQKLEITTNYSGGAYDGGGENTIAIFGSEKDDNYNLYADIRAIRNFQNNNGLVMCAKRTDEASSNIAKIHLHVDSTGERFLRPIPQTGTGYPHYLGSGNHRWETIYSVNTLNTSSDITLKTNIQYLSEVPNVNAKTNDTLNINDMYDFIKNDLYLATYNWRDSSDNNLKIGFIAQDIVDTKVGSEIITCNREQDNTLGYDTGNYTSVLAGALKVAIQKVEQLEARIQKLEEEVKKNEGNVQG